MRQAVIAGCWPPLDSIPTVPLSTVTRLELGGDQLSSYISGDSIAKLDLIEEELTTQAIDHLEESSLGPVLRRMTFEGLGHFWFALGMAASGHWPWVSDLCDQDIARCKACAVRALLAWWPRFLKLDQVFHQTMFGCGWPLWAYKWANKADTIAGRPIFGQWYRLGHPDVFPDDAEENPGAASAKIITALGPADVYARIEGAIISAFGDGPLEWCEPRPECLKKPRQTRPESPPESPVSNS